MRALVLESFGAMAVRDLVAPEPGRGEVALDVALTGICGSDLHGFTGENGRRVPGQVMGHEASGRIAAVGAGVPAGMFPLGAPATFNPVLVPDDELDAFAGREQQAPGKRVVGVTTDLVSAFAERIVVPARNVVLLSDAVPLTHGALVEPLAVAAHAVRRANAVGASHALVIGGGPVGQSVVIALQAAGVEEITVSEVNADRRALCERLGARAIDPTAGQVAAQLRAATGRLADVSLDAVGLTATVAAALEATVLGGTVCLVGMGAPKVELEAYRLSTDERSLVGSFTYSAEEFREAAGWVSAGIADFDAMISKIVPLEEAGGEFARQAAGETSPGKVLVQVTRAVAAVSAGRPRAEVGA